MAFTKRDVKDRLVQYPRRYQLVEVQPGIFDLVPAPGTITEPGTPINKAYLQPIEDGLADALEKTGNGKDVTVAFTEAAAEAHIASGESLAVMFGKILKKFKSIVPVALGGTGSNTVAGARNNLGLGNTSGALPVANGGTGAANATNARTNLGVPPTSHASTGTSYGVATEANYGHCKTINNLNKTSFVNGEVLSAYQGKVLKDLINDKQIISGTYTGNKTAGRVISLPFTPKAILVTNAWGGNSSAASGRSVALAVTGQSHGTSASSLVAITNNGFKLDDADYFNSSGNKYNYVAIQ